MAETTKIEWCDSTFNPWIGCTKVSTAAAGGGGCDHCYAEVSTPARVMRGQGRETWGPGAARKRTSDALWREPRAWNAEPFAECMHCGWRGELNRCSVVLNPSGFHPPINSARLCKHCERPTLKEARRRVFCASLADVFDNEVDPRWRADLFALIAATPGLDWLLLTKRIGNAGKMIEQALDMLSTTLHGLPWPWSNVWLGATVVNQAEADRDVPKLLTTRAARRFVSIEPMLSEIDLTELQPAGMLRMWVDALRGSAAAMGGSGPAHALPRLDWVIAGGESGHGARPAHPDWFSSLRTQCKNDGVPFLFKQWGEWKPCSQMSVSEKRETAQITSAEDVYVRPNGSTHTVARDDHEPYDPGDSLVRRVGKKAAGRTLDGREHTAFPGVRHG